MDKGAYVDSDSYVQDEKRKMASWYMTNKEAGPTKTSLMFWYSY